ncbi:VWA domain-containing protein [Thalassotalea sp. LPB0316]|uniref:vWA domain-containing protein n=1 Tax=Thalassotalea sp. LPB0316 TaxID=2769490 RepID=UPI001868203E|nr:VWA domain-containing protein [Thalassotalea sp. LPB0316]QOL24439.1 VWA domain-containing protein [Thalassotalea sp. LPB0316]
MADFHFLRPLWFIALLALPLIIWLLKKLSYQYSGWQQVIPAHLQQVLMANNSNKQQTSAVLPVVIYLLVITALAGPTYQKLPQPVFNVERGSVIVMDMSYSMYSTDIAPNRLTRARFKAIDILDNINEGDIGLVAYAGAAFIISPLTQDINNIKLLLPSLTPEIMPEVGSDPFPALLTANDMLVNAGHLKGDIYWLTDDVDRFDLEAIQEFIKDYPHRLNILGIGSTEGAPITLPNGELLKDDSGQIVIPKLPVGKLNGLASQSGGQYRTISHNNSDIEALTSYQLPSDSKEQDEEQSQLGDSWQELGPYLVLLILPLVLSYFRRGVILSLAPLAFLIMPNAPAIAQNAPEQSTQATAPQQPSAIEQSWQNLWQTQNQQAQQKYNNQQFAQAAQQFEDPMWQASAHYRAGNYQASVDALEGLNNPSALYNKGNALAKLGKFDDAIAAYEQALEQQPDFEQASNNKKLLEQLKDQQEQQNQQQDQSQQQGNQNNQQQDQQGQQQGDQEQSEQNSDQREDQQGSQQQDQQSQEQQENDKQDQQQNNQNQESQSQQDKQQEQQEQNAQAQQNEQEQKAQQMSQAQAQLDEQKQKELEQKHMQLLNKVTDDPHLLLRNKMQLEYQKRRHQNSGAKKKW